MVEGINYHRVKGKKLTFKVMAGIYRTGNEASCMTLNFGYEKRSDRMLPLIHILNTDRFTAIRR